MKKLILALLLTACGSADDHSEAPKEQAASAANQEPAIDGSERPVRMVRVDVEQRPYYTFYDLGINGVISSPEYETHGWKLAYAIKEGAKPGNCNDGELTGADWPPLTVKNVKPNTHYFIIACPVHAVRGEYGQPLVSEFTTGSLKE